MYVKLLARDRRSVLFPFPSFSESPALGNQKGPPGRAHPGAKPRGQEPTTPFTTQPHAPSPRHSQPGAGRVGSCGTPFPLPSSLQPLQELRILLGLEASRA